MGDSWGTQSKDSMNYFATSCKSIIISKEKNLKSNPGVLTGIAVNYTLVLGVIDPFTMLSSHVHVFIAFEKCLSFIAFINQDKTRDFNVCLHQV